MTNSDIDRWYDIGREHGAIGGKLIGAGGGGFLMFYTPDPTPVRQAMEAQGLMELHYDFDYFGTSLL